MQLRNKYYPYPVLVENGDYYENSSFVSRAEHELDGYNIKLKLFAELNDNLLLSMIDAGDLAYVHHIECPQTCYRKVIKTSNSYKEVVIKDNELSGDVQVCSFIVAENNIEKYENPNFVIKGFKYNIDKGCIMAIGQQYDLKINKKRDDFQNTASIFSIVKSLNETQTGMLVDIEKPKIIISLPEKSYNQYNNVKGYIELQSVMHEMIIVPALVYTFAELKINRENLYEYEDYRWFRGLEKACKKINLKLDAETLENLDCLKVAQQLLDNPLIKALEYCATGGGTIED